MWQSAAKPRMEEGSTTKYERNLSSPVQDSSKEDEDIV